MPKLLDLKKLYGDTYVIRLPHHSTDHTQQYLDCGRRGRIFAAGVTSLRLEIPTDGENLGLQKKLAALKITLADDGAKAIAEFHLDQSDEILGIMHPRRLKEDRKVKSPAPRLSVEERRRQAGLCLVCGEKVYGQGATHAQCNVQKLSDRMLKESRQLHRQRAADRRRKAG